MKRRPTSRRRFLEAATGAALATSAAMLRAADAREPVRVAVIGTGARGSDLLRALTTLDGVQVVGLCDNYAPHLERASRFAAPGTPRFANAEQMLAQAKPQAVVIAVPLAEHYRVTSLALDAGCDVFCEKTMCYSLDEARRLVAQVEQSGRVFQVGLQRRANVIYQQAVAMIRAGMLGQISAVKCQWHRNNNWRRPIPVPRGDAQWSALEHQLNWRLYQRSSGGLMAELGSHQLDVVNWCLGTTPKRVVASGGIDYWRDGRDVADNIFCIYEYELPVAATPAPAAATANQQPGGRSTHTVRVTYSSLCNNAYEGASELIMGTRGTLYLTSGKGLMFRERTADDVGWAPRRAASDNQQDDAALITSGKTLKLSNSPWAHRGEPVELDYLQGDDTRDELMSFVNHVRTRNVKTICDVQEGLRDTATVLMANEAMKSGTTVAWPLDAAPRAITATPRG
ncbi:MAG: Gfo/Idh/MocA family oxidoreductase [Planctomycetes bacterium]|nr:Gfo/Idh/MocA family oxidoreductase [Planctomycetota bacterium]